MSVRRVLVTGSRNWPDRRQVWKAIFDRYLDAPIETRLIVVHGDCRTGADRHAREFCERDGVSPYIFQEAHPADWDQHGKAAGMLRNQEMVNLGADVCLAFPMFGSRGTRDCMRRAAKAGIPVIVFSDPQAVTT